MISIILPTYNESVVIAKTLTALAKAIQRVDVPVEVVLVDSSPDDLTALAAQAVDLPCPLRIVRLPGKRGAGYARNAGVNAAAYPFIATVDAAVLVEPEWLATLWSTQQATQADLVWGNTLHGPTNAFERSYLRSFYRPSFSRRFMNNLLIRKSVYLELGGLNERVHSGEDLELFAKLDHSSYHEEYVEALSTYTGYPSSIKAILHKWTTFTSDNVVIGVAKAKFIFVGFEVMTLLMVGIGLMINLVLGISLLVLWLVSRFVAQVWLAKRPFESLIEVPMTFGLILVFDYSRLLGLVNGLSRLRKENP